MNNKKALLRETTRGVPTAALESFAILSGGRVPLSWLGGGGCPHPGFRGAWLGGGVPRPVLAGYPRPLQDLEQDFGQDQW